MPLFAAIDRPVSYISVYASAMEYTHELPFRNYFETDAMRSMLPEIRVAGVVYPLRQACATDFIPGIGDFLVEGFSPTFVGHGATYSEAREDWALSVHAAFQELQYKRPFEMTPEDIEKWSVLSSRIDVIVFRNKLPIHVREFGKIVSKRLAYPNMLQWENGKKEVITLDQVDSPDFVTYKVGQPIEAVVARDPLTFNLIRIIDIHRRSSVSRLNTNEETQLLNDIGSAKNLPAADW
jgi:hypothetical protein